MRDRREVHDRFPGMNVLRISGGQHNWLIGLFGEGSCSAVIIFPTLPSDGDRVKYALKEVGALFPEAYQIAIMDPKLSTYYQDHPLTP